MNASLAKMGICYAMGESWNSILSPPLVKNSILYLKPYLLYYIYYILPTSILMKSHLGYHSVQTDNNLLMMMALIILVLNAITNIYAVIYLKRGKSLQGGSSIGTNFFLILCGQKHGCYHTNTV